MREGVRREIDTEYGAQRAQNRAEETRRLSEATARDPMIGGLVADRMRLFRQGAQDALANPARAHDISARLSQRIAAMQTELRDRLLALGLPADYLQPIYACEKCHDTGYVGEPVRERCECYGRRMRQRLTRESGSGIDAAETFEAWDDGVFDDQPLAGRPDHTQRTLMRRVREVCEAYADAFPHPARPNLLLFGKSGLGKTYLLNCIAGRVTAGGHEALKITAYQMSERMRASVFDRDPDAFSQLLSVPLLLLDDLGVEPLYNNITIEHLFTLLNERQLAGRATVLSTNLMLDELRGRYSERVISRVFDRRRTVIIEVLGRDVRLGLGDV